MCTPMRAVRRCVPLCVAEHCWFLVEVVTSFPDRREPVVSGRVDGLLFLRCPGLDGLNLQGTNLDAKAQDALKVGLVPLATCATLVEGGLFRAVSGG